MPKEVKFLDANELIKIYNNADGKFDIAQGDKILIKLNSGQMLRKVRHQL